MSIEIGVMMCGTVKRVICVDLWAVARTSGIAIAHWRVKILSIWFIVSTPNFLTTVCIVSNVSN